MQSENGSGSSDAKLLPSPPWQHRWVGFFYGRLFDPPMRLLSSGFSNFATIRVMMKQEEDFWTAEGRKRIKYILMLMQYLYSRASTLLTHISVMIAMLTVIAASQKGANANGPYFFFVSFGIFIYLIIAIAMIRCLRDIGLDKGYGSPEEYEKETLEELGFRFSLIRFSNIAAIVATVGFVIGSFVDFIVRDLI
jgi:hypothetical protein